MQKALTAISDAGVEREILINDTRMNAQRKTDAFLRTKRAMRESIQRFMAPMYKDPKYRRLLQDDTTYTSGRDFFERMLGSKGEGNERIKVK
jgi:hypothetical protein